MKKFVVTSTVLGLLALAPAAFAQEDHDKGGHPGQGGGHGPAGPAAHGPERSAGAPGGGHNGGAMPQHGPPVGARAPGAAPGGPMREAAPGRAGRAPEAASRGGPAAEGPRGRAIAPAPTSRNAMATGQRSGAGSARRSADITALRGNVQAPRRFHANAYRPPAGFVSRRWAYGERLPRAYFARNYWITNFLLFGLFGPPPGFVWVRVGPDALLIDEFTGEIVRVEYGVFY